MDISNINSDLIRGNVTTVILRALLDEDRYGYDILREIEVKSQGQYKLKQATLYSCLKRLEKQGLISSYWGEIDQTEGGRRRYYKLTDDGRSFLNKMQSEYEYSRTILDKLLSEKEFDFNAPAPYDINALRPFTKRTSGDNAEDCKEPEQPQTATNPVGFGIQNTAISSSASDQKHEEAAQQSFFDDVKKEKDISISYSVKEDPTTPEVNAFTDTRPRVVNKSLDEILGEIENKIGSTEKTRVDNVLKNTDDIKPETDADAPKREYYRPEKFQSEVMEQPKEERHVYPLTEEQRRSREEAAKRLGLGKFSDNTSINYEKFGIERPKVPQNDDKKEVLTDSDGEDPARRKPKNADKISVAKTETFQKAPEPVKKDSELSDIKYAFADVPKKTTSAPVQQTPPKARSASSFEFRKAESSYNYKDVFSDFYNRADTYVDDEKSEKTAKKLSPVPSATDLRTKLFAEGYKMRTYTRANAENYYSLNFLSINRLNRDCYGIMYLILIVEVLIGWLILGNKLNTMYYLGVCAIGLIMPLVPFIQYLFNPDRRIRADFNFKLSIESRSMLYLNCFVVVALIGFFGFSADINDISSLVPTIIIPDILLLNLPISSIITALLYGSKRYHIA